MSQRKLKKIRQENAVSQVKEPVVVIQGIWQIIRENILFLVAVVVVSALIYANGWAANFVSDDYATIPNNPDITNFVTTMKLTPNIVSMSNTIIANMFGISSSIAFHVFNSIVFALVLITMFVLIYQMMGKTLAIMSVSLFAVHPIHVEAITWISGKPYSLFSFFSLIVLSSLILLFNKKGKKYLWLSLLNLIFCFKTDSTRTLGLVVFVIPLVVLYGDFLKGLKIDWVKVFLIGGALMALILFLVWPNIVNRVNTVNSGYNSSESVFYDPFFQYPTAMAKYLQLLYLPIDLTLYHTMFVLPTWLNWAILLSFATCIIYFHFRNKRMSFALLFIFAGAAASMAPVKVSWLVAERYMFFGSIGFCLFLAIILEDIYYRFKYVAYGLLVGILVFYSVRLFFRNIDWQTNHNLWVNTCQVSPNSHNAWNNIGDDYDKLKQYDNAVKGFTQSTVVKPNYADAYHNRANIFFKTGRLDLARDSYNTALHYSPGLYQTYLSLVQIDLMEKKLDLALTHAQEALKISPSDPQAGYVLAIVYSQMGQIDAANIVLNKILELYPNYSLAAQALTQLNAIPKK